MEKHAASALNGSALQDFSSVHVLDDGRTINDFIDDKIKTLQSEVSVEGSSTLLHPLESVIDRHQQWLTLLPRVKPFYAVKCNNTPAVLRVLRALSTGFDCASKAEIQMVLNLGVSPDKIIFAHTTKPMSHIRFAAAQRVQTMTFDSEEELRKISLCHPKARLVLRIAVDDSDSLLRLSSKFGAGLGLVEKLLGLAVDLDLTVIGVSFHVGSGCTESQAFQRAISDARQVFDIAMSLLDIGGGFSGRDDFQVKFEEFSDVINAALDKFFPPDCGVQIIAEPGRFYVESAFTLAVNVIAKKNCEESGPGGQMMYYINDGVYGSLSCIVNDPAHPPVQLLPHRVNTPPWGVGEVRHRSVVWGPTCDSFDKVSDSAMITELQVGDWLLVHHMGAYSVSLICDFNGFERAKVFPVVTEETRRLLELRHTSA
ncbi:Ornithine decarboxylase [Dissostichus eleginoides]|uniref:Ornithine decarboxylase n=1 Tax=Dissostichus eleginoides TaxID=100907 RepID=A0AAD9ET19_DISEL|nr:Ornithine decarboxylase [Dissostichus eleginoides]